MCNCLSVILGIIMQRFPELLRQILTLCSCALTACVITCKVEVITGQYGIQDNTYQSGNSQA